MDGYVFDMLLGLDAGNLVLTAATWMLFPAVGWGSDPGDRAPDGDPALLPERTTRPHVPEAWHVKDRCEAPRVSALRAGVRPPAAASSTGARTGRPC